MTDEGKWIEEAKAMTAHRAETDEPISQDVVALVERVSVHKIEPGSLIILELGEGYGTEVDYLSEQLIGELKKHVGHDQFVLLFLGSGARAEAFGPEEIKEKLRAALG